MNKAITWTTLLQNLKSVLISKDFEDTQIKFALNRSKIPPFQKTRCIVIIPSSITEIEEGNKFYVEKSYISVVILQKITNIDDDSEYISFFDFIKEIKGCLRDETFDNQIIDTKIEITENFDTIIGGEQSFIHSAELSYSCIIKGI